MISSRFLYIILGLGKDRDILSLVFNYDFKKNQQIKILTAIYSLLFIFLTKDTNKLSQQQIHFQNNNKTTKKKMQQIQSSTPRQRFMPPITQTPRRKKTLIKSRPSRFKSQPVNISTNRSLSVAQNKLIPNNIFQDKETLYHQVIQLKKVVNALREDNLKLKAKIVAIPGDRSGQSENDTALSRDVHRSHSKAQNHPYQIKVQCQNLRRQNTILNKENRILTEQIQKLKRMPKTIQIAQLQVQNRTIIEQNSKLAQKNQQLRKRIQVYHNRIDQYDNNEKILMREKKGHVSQVENLYFQIMQLQSQMRKQKERFASREKRLTQVIGQQKKKLFKNSKEMHQLRKQQLKKQGFLRSSKGQERLKNTSFKSHHLRVQPLRSQRISSDLKFEEEPPSPKELLKQQFNQMSEARNENQLNEYETEIQILKKELKEKQMKLCQAEDRIREAEDKLNKIQSGKVESKPSNVQTNFSEDLEKPVENQIQKPQSIAEVSEPVHSSVFEQKSMEERSEAKIEKNNQENVEEKERSHKDTEKMSRKESVREKMTEKEYVEGECEREEPKEEQNILLFQKNEEPQKIQNSEQSFFKRYQSEVNHSLPQSINEDQSQFEEINYKKTLSTKQKEHKSSQLSKKILNNIKTLLTYRLKHQKYTFTDLKTDIQSSEVKFFNYTDLCVMFVNEPFFFSVEHCKTVIKFIFQDKKLGTQEKVSSTQLIIKLRRFIEDFQPLSLQSQKVIVERCSSILQQHSTTLQQLFQISSNSNQTLPLSKFLQILSKCQLTLPQLQFLVAETSLHSQDLEHINYNIIFERLVPDNESTISEPKREVIMEQDGEDYSQIAKSNNMKAKQKQRYESKEQEKDQQQKKEQEKELDNVNAISKQLSQKQLQIMKTPEHMQKES